MRPSRRLAVLRLCRLPREPAGNIMAIPYPGLRRHFPATDILCIGASGPERTPRRHVPQIGWLALDLEQSFTLIPQPRHRLHQPTGVWMGGGFVDSAYRTILDDVARIHHDHA